MIRAGSLLTCLYGAALIAIPSTKPFSENKSPESTSWEQPKPEPPQLQVPFAGVGSGPHMDRLDHAMQAAEAGDFARALVFLQPYPFDATMDQERAFKLFCFIASKGYTQAYYWVGICYELGSGVAMDLSRAHACFQMGAEAQDADCILRQAYLYEQGLGMASRWWCAPSRVPSSCVPPPRNTLGNGDSGRALSMASPRRPASPSICPSS
jgi:hypothetical protein